MQMGVAYMGRYKIIRFYALRFKKSKVDCYIASFADYTLFFTVWNYLLLCSRSQRLPFPIENLPGVCSLVHVVLPYKSTIVLQSHLNS